MTFPGVPLPHFARIARGAGLITAAVGATALAGWVLRIEALSRLMVGAITMKANTAIGLIASGLALALLAARSSRLRDGSVALAVLATAIGGLTLSQHLGGWNLGIDELLFTEPTGAAGTTSPGRMGPNAATGLLLGGLAIVLCRRGTPRTVLWAQAFACTMAVLATIPLAGYVYGAQQLYSVARFTGIAFPTAISLLALSIGILAVRPDMGPVAVLSASGPGGVLARRLLLPAVALPLVLGYVRILGQRIELYDTGLGIALLTISLAVVFVGLVWRTAIQLNLVDAKRSRAEQARIELLGREQQARVEVERANRLKDHFLAALSHELRTPLNAILGYARMLRTGLLPAEKHRRAIEIIERNAAAQNQLVDDLLDMSRMTTGRIRLEKHSVPLIAPLQEAIESVRPAAEARRISLLVEPDLAAGSIHGDEGRLRQIFWNLLWNAVKFTPEGGRIDVGLQSGRDSVSVTVRDSGIGIEPEFLPHVFEPFRQADGGSARRHSGLGLGLAICKQLTELHGGSITAASEGAGRGASFTVELPRIAADMADVPTLPGGGGPLAPSVPLLPPERPLSGIDVLVVEDEPDSLELALQLLESAGAAVRIASNAAEALRQFDAREPDLVVADIGLPGMDGCELLQEIRARLGPKGTRVPAVAVTAYARSDDRRRTREAGFEDHIAKPIDPDVFVHAAVSAVRRSRSGHPQDLSLT